MTKTYSKACKQLKAEYKKEKHKHGWRVLMCPADRLNAKTQIALLTLNPGGSSDKQKKGEPSCEHGSAYVCESWCGKKPGAAPLQKQIRKLFKAIAANVDRVGDGDKLLLESLAACYIPFRSKSINVLAQKKSVKGFAYRLWEPLFKEIDPLLIVTIDQMATKAIKKILKEKLKCPAIPYKKPLKVGWGAYCADVFTFNAKQGKRVILRLPHLSRYQLFGRKNKESQKKIEKVISCAVRASSLPKRTK